MRPNHITLALLAAFGLIVPAHAFEPFVIKEIRVEGIQRTEAGTVYNYLPVKVGERVDDAKVRDAIKALFATGFYNDVRIEADKGVLIVSLDERPVIAEIRIEGAKEFETDQLMKALRENGLAESRTFDRSILEAAEQELKKQYYSRGKYSVQFKTTVTRLERNRVAISFDISEGLVAQIRQINLVGNQSFGDKELLDYFQLTTPGWLTWFTKNDQYSKPKLQADIEALRSFYLDRGYLEFNIDSQQVALSEDKKDIFLTVNLSEGQKYTITDIKFAGELIVAEAELRKLVDIKPGDVFARSKINQATKAINDRLSDEGYAFANVNAVPEINKEKNTAAFTFYVDPGRKTYVRRININGNLRTRDEVIRREMRQLEGAPYSGWKLRRSKERLDLLGFFSEVTIDTPLVADSTDQVDVNVTVTEKQTGNINIGAGYSRDDGFTIIGGFEQSNIFGTGKYLKVDLNTGKSRQVYSLSFSNPYATPDGVARGFSIYKTRYEPNATNDVVSEYVASVIGGELNWSVPISEYDGISFSLAADRSSYSISERTSATLRKELERVGNNPKTFRASVGWARDTRDSALSPTRGVMRRLGASVAVPGSDYKYYKLTAQQQWFFPLSKDFTFLWNIEGGYARGYGGEALPFTQRFNAGGVGSVRGYETASLGPKERNSFNDYVAVGGNRTLINNFELLLPVPGLKNDNSTRLSLFVDGGTVWGEDEKFDFKAMRYSAGIAFQWIGPLGPMKFSLARPLNAKKDSIAIVDGKETTIKGDELRRFQFQLGRTF
ncbi:outer membrane protein assembly factor BamA [Chitinimonas lacunae]|uniref:Outer membrane protein assembly factor BamA n=1 Tax=Chitinimonas lacunae TaxID=1963018 RepID=A0ABV8MTE5_9NEIS